MWQAILDFVGGIFKPAADLIDNVHTSEEEKLELRNVFVKLQNEVTLKQMELVSKQLDFEKELMQKESDIIKAEAQSESWIVYSWRPITMLVFLLLIVLKALGVIQLEEKFAENFMTLVEIGLGGYVIGRSVEKAAPSIVQAIKGR